MVQILPGSRHRRRHACFVSGFRVRAGRTQRQRSSRPIRNCVRQLRARDDCRKNAAQSHTARKGNTLQEGYGEVTGLWVHPGTNPHAAHGRRKFKALQCALTRHETACESKVKTTLFTTTILFTTTTLFATTTLFCNNNPFYNNNNNPFIQQQPLL